MVLKKKILNTRSKLIILLVIFIILIGYVVITNLPPTVDYVTPNQVIKNSDLYLNKTIIIKGYLDKNSANYSIITNTIDKTNPRDELRVDYSNILNTDKLIEEKLYYFTGILKILGEPSPVSNYIFYAEKFEAV